MNDNETDKNVVLRRNDYNCAKNSLDATIASLRYLNKSYRLALQAGSLDKPSPAFMNLNSALM